MGLLSRNQCLCRRGQSLGAEEDDDPSAYKHGESRIEHDDLYVGALALPAAQDPDELRRYRMGDGHGAGWRRQGLGHARDVGRHAARRDRRGGTSFRS